MATLSEAMRLSGYRGAVADVAGLRVSVTPGTRSNTPDDPRRDEIIERMVSGWSAALEDKGAIEELEQIARTRELEYGSRSGYWVEAEFVGQLPFSSVWLYTSRGVSVYLASRQVNLNADYWQPDDTWND